MYSFVRQRINVGSEKTKSLAGGKSSKETYTSHKCKSLAQLTVQNYPC